MIVASGGSVTTVFTTNDADGAAADADSTPTGTLYVNGTANGATVTVTNISTGEYKAAVTLPALSSGDIVSIRISATIDTVAAKAKVWEAVCSPQVNLVDSAITANKLASDAITAAKIATDAIGSTQLAATALAEINAEVDTALSDWGKTGFSLASTGLDAVTIAEPGGEPEFGTSSVRQAIAALIARFFNKSSVTRSSSTAGTFAVRNVADNANLWTQALTDDGTTSTAGKAT